MPAAVSLLPPADPLRQANRLPIRVLKMLSAHTGHLLHPEYLQPLSSTPVSPIEVSLLVSARPAPTPIRPVPPGPRPYFLRPGARCDLRSGHAGVRGKEAGRSESTRLPPGFSVEGSPSTLALRSYVFFLGLGLLLESPLGALLFARHPVPKPEIAPAPFPPTPTAGFVLFEVRVARAPLRLCPIRFGSTTPRRSRYQVFLPLPWVPSPGGREGLLSANGSPRFRRRLSPLLPRGATARNPSQAKFPQLME